MDGSAAIVMGATTAAPLPADAPLSPTSPTTTATAAAALLHLAVPRLRALLTHSLQKPTLLSAHDHITTTPPLQDFLLAAWLALLLLALRAAAERALLPPLTRCLARATNRAKPSSPSSSAAAFAVLDSAWIAVFAVALTGMAWWVVLTDNGGCTPWSTAACFAGWPHHPVAPCQRWYMVLAFSYYLYELLGLAVGVGTRLKADMVAHHFATMALIVIAYPTTLERMSVMWQALFDLSNPILHSAKALHASGLKQLEGVKWALFNLFALTFLLCRVIGGPISILWPSFTIAKEVLPASYCHVCWGLEIFVYVLQLVWFYKIVEIATKGDKAVPAKVVPCKEE